MITLQQILDVDGGQSYIISRYADAFDSFVNTKKKFKTRTEKTESASVYKDDGVWYVTDFGEDSKRRNAVDICMKEDGVDFGTAIKTVAAFYNIEGAAAGGPKPNRDKWPAKADEAEGAMTLEYKEFGFAEIRCLLSKKTMEYLGKTDAEVLKKVAPILANYHFKALAAYNYTKEGVTYRYMSTEHFPMFSIEEEGFKKIYKPLDQKKYRFFSTGKKPANFIHGWAQLVKYVEATRAEKDKEKVDAQQYDAGDSVEEADKKRTSKWKAPEVILASGGSDAINMACFGYKVMWLNSETASVSEAMMTNVQKKAWKVYGCFDIDETGMEKAHELCMQHLDLMNIELPSSLLELKDNRGNACKDVRDYLNHYTKWDFDLLVQTAKPYQFWNEQIKMKDGEPVKKFGKTVIDYVLNNTRMYNFVFKNGYGRLLSEKEKEGYEFVKVTNHVVSQVKATQIEDFVHSFLESRYFTEELRNVFYKSPQMSENSLRKIGYMDLDFRPFGKDYQYLFFRTWNNYKAKYDSVAWKITANGIEEVKKKIGVYVWEQKVIERKAKVLDAFFKIGGSEENGFELEILDDSPLVMRFIIQTCRVHWRAELEERLGIMTELKTIQERNEYAEKYQLTEDDKLRIFDAKNTEGSDFVKKYKEKYKFSLTGYLLTEREKEEQVRHFVNRIFCLGYMMHRYKNPSKPWGLWIMDGKISEEGQSHGGSGKSLFTLLLQKLNLSVVPLAGRNPKLTDNPHVFENIDRASDLVNVDDCCDYFNFGYFFDSITGPTKVNPKNKNGFALPFEEAPKFLFSSNYGDRSTDPSSLRRKLYSVTSDYYHENNGEYNESRNPAEELGGNLFDEWPDSEWEKYFNFMAQALSFYLGTDAKIGPPMSNIQKRNLISEMTESFKAWADVFFDPSVGNLNRWVMKEIAFKDFLSKTNTRSHSSQKFKDKLKAYCRYMKYDFNPDGVGSHIRKVTVTDEKGERQTSAEHIYISVSLDDLAEQVAAQAGGEKTMDLF